VNKSYSRIETVAARVKISGSAKKGLKYLLSYVPTPGWTQRFPHLNRLEKCKIDVLCEILLREAGHMVFSGPFATMKLESGLALGRDPRMIVGSYELEIHEVINEVISRAPVNIIDIGAAYGYYAVGLALKVSATRVVAFEAVEEKHWRQLSELASLNGVGSKIIQRGLCTPGALAEFCVPKSFVLSDCEGAEEDLLDPVAVPALRSCTVLIELHEFHRPRVVPLLVDRFKESHAVRIIEERSRDPSLYRILKQLPSHWRSVAIEEAKWISEASKPRTTTSLRFMLLTPRGTTE